MRRLFLSLFILLISITFVSVVYAYDDSCNSDSDCILNVPSEMEKCHQCGFHADFTNDFSLNPSYSDEDLVVAISKNWSPMCPVVNISGGGCIAGRPVYFTNYTAKCVNNKCMKAIKSSSGTVESNKSGNFSIPAVCGNGICELYEADDPGGCGPNASSECLGPPSQKGTCPQDCNKNKSLPGEGKTKILPETASQRAKERLGELGFNITLKEVGNGDETKQFYEARAETEGKIFGLFKKKAIVIAEIDAETGDVIKVRNPWWAFIASGI